MTSRAALLAAFLLLLPGGVRTEPQGPPVFGTAVDVVRLDVVVLDRDGKPVTGLARDDFEIEEGGRPQAISSFEPVVVRGAPPVPATEPPRLSQARVRAPAEGRCLFVLFDDIHVSPVTAERVREALRRFVATELRDGDWVTLMTSDKELWWTARNAWEYGQLAGVIARLAGRGRGDTYADWESLRATEQGLGGATSGSAIMAGGGARPVGNPTSGSDEPVMGVGRKDAGFLGTETVAVVQRRTGITLGALRAALESLAPLRGQKSLVLVSEGFMLLPKMPGYDETIDLARRANVAIHFLDVRGLESGTSAEAMTASTMMPGTAFALPAGDTEGIAEVTGGRTLVSNDPGVGLRRVAAEAEAYYLLGYTPGSSAPGERRVRVKVKREGLSVRARSRYFVPEPGKAGPSTPAPSPAVVAMRSLADTTDLLLRVATFFFEANTKGEIATMLATEVVPPPGKTGRRLFKLVSEARARDGGKPVLDQFEGSPDVRAGVPVILARQWHLPPGVWQVRLFVEDTTTGRVGTAIHTFEVPDPKRFRFSTPILTAELEDPNARKLKVALGRTFRTGTIVYCQYNVYGGRTGKSDWVPHAMGSWALRRGDELVREAPPTLIQPGGDGRLTRTLGLSLQSAPPGDYMLTLTVRDEQSGETLVRTEPFTVAP